MANSRIERNMTPIPVPRHRKGDPLLADAFNETVKSINRILPKIKPPQGNIGADRAVPPKIQQFKISEVNDDYVVAKPFNGVDDPNAEPIYIAKPYLLRKTPFHGASRTVNGVTIAYAYVSVKERVAQTLSPPKTENQVIVPAYEKDDLIYAAYGIIGGTNVTLPEGNSAQDPNIEWIDLNLDGRAWAKKKN